MLVFSVFEVWGLWFGFWCFAFSVLDYLKHQGLGKEANAKVSSLFLAVKSEADIVT